MSRLTLTSCSPSAPTSTTAATCSTRDNGRVPPRTRRRRTRLLRPGGEPAMRDRRGPLVGPLPAIRRQERLPPVLPGRLHPQHQRGHRPRHRGTLPGGRHRRSVPGDELDVQRDRRAQNQANAASFLDQQRPPGGAVPAVHERRQSQLRPRSCGWGRRLLSVRWRLVLVLAAGRHQLQAADTIVHHAAGWRRHDLPDLLRHRARLGLRVRGDPQPRHRHVVDRSGPERPHQRRHRRVLPGGLVRAASVAGAVPGADCSGAGWNASSGRSTAGRSGASTSMASRNPNEIEVFISYASDWASQGLGTFVDSIQMPGEAVESFETDEGAWSVGGPPAGSDPNPTSSEPRTSASRRGPSTRRRRRRRLRDAVLRVRVRGTPTGPAAKTSWTQALPSLASSRHLHHAGVAGPPGPASRRWHRLPPPHPAWARGS